MDAGSYSTTDFGAPRKTSGAHGYVAYFPKPIPREIRLSASTIKMLSEADAALGQLSGVGQHLPNPHLLMRPYLLREALASTRIEGTQASLQQMFEFEAQGGTPNADLEEVIAYIDALEWGIERLEALPISLRLLREMHERILAGVRGRDRRPSELRTSQNWIGGAGSTITNARFVPPPPEQLSALLTDWEQFANADLETPILIQDALLHYQFETLHPFLDGNGRLGRLLLVLFLIARDRLTKPLLYLSATFERDRRRYYDALQLPRESGDIEPWIQLFLEAVQREATDALTRTQRVIELRDSYHSRASSISSTNASALVDLVCESPVLTAQFVQTRLHVSRPTALSLLRRLTSLGVVQETESGGRGQLRFVASELLDALSVDSSR